MEPTGKTSEEVEVPKLAENGRNWKIYRVKIIEAAATDITDPLGVLAGWQPDDGSYNWECLDAILKWTFYTLVLITILRPIRKLDTTHKIFNYLAKRFCDNNPIVDPHTKKSEPSTNKVDGAGTAAEDISADLEKQKESPTSESAAAETLTSANRDEEDLPCTQDLTRGTQDVNDGNVRCTQDPRMSLEASAQGTSAKHAEMTPVMLKSTLPHETPNQLQNSLQATRWRLPIEDEPCTCEQEAVESVVMARCMKGTAQSANPPEMDANVDSTTSLGGELAKRVSGVDEGDGMEREPQSWLQELKLLCGEIIQHSRIANENIPIAHGVLLEGEWTWCASGEATNLKGNANAFNTAIEHVDGSDESTETTNTKDIESEGCKGSTDERASVDKADGDASHGTGPADTSNELTEFIAMLIELEDLGSGGIPHGQSDVLKGHGDSAGMYLSAGGAKHPVYETDGARTHVGTLTRQTDASSVKTNTVIPANMPENIRSSQKKAKPPDLPVEASRRRPDEPDGCGNHADASSAHTDSHCIGNGTETAENNSRNVSKCQMEAQTQYSPNAPEIKTSKPICRWRKVSGGNIDGYVPWNAPVEAPSQMFAFGEAESRDKVIAPDIEGETAEGNGDGDGDRYGDDGDGNGITSGGSIDSVRVNAALLAVESHPSDI
ncbi:hypothetical protein SCLCIDRAFT_27615 [Scleroderma citrinum Foug A]|uniref:Uncharacterized protein n=1 Tax=Scleroderma citrinum Foug A TaxID=1036808 RepID=A0A0C3DSU2_9AGAM|nr:hypothetical protein SCLCIDRAFT_27615 [Scleroderma citrinum Foug A]